MCKKYYKQNKIRKIQNFVNASQKDKTIVND